MQRPVIGSPFHRAISSAGATSARRVPKTPGAVFLRPVAVVRWERGSFFSPQTQAFQCPREGGRMHRNASSSLQLVLQLVQSSIGLLGDELLQCRLMFLQRACPPACWRQGITAPCGAPAQQPFFKRGQTDPKLFCEFGLRVVFMIFIKLNHAGTEIIRIRFWHADNDFRFFP